MGNRGHKVKPLSVKKIREVSDLVSRTIEVLGGKTDGVRDIIDILDIRLPQLNPKFALEILDDCDLPNDYARTYPEHFLIQVRLSVYNGARAGNPRDRFTLAHEIGHLFLHQEEVVAYARNDSPHKIYEDSEWQADVFAAELLMPYSEAVFVTSAEEMMEKFNVSQQAAHHRMTDIKKR